MRSTLLLIASLLLIYMPLQAVDENTTEKQSQTKESAATCHSTSETNQEKTHCDDKSHNASSPQSQSFSHQHFKDVDRRGDDVMGFDHTKTTHHFYLKPNGGIIEVTVKDAEDIESRESVRKHLREISNLFKNGDFTPAKQIHDREPSGSQTMSELKNEIQYSFEEIPEGARIVIQTEHEKAKEAVHEFLKFQIQDHRTGDPLEVQ